LVYLKSSWQDDGTDDNHKVRMEATFEEGQGPEGAVVPWMDGWNDNVNNNFFAINVSVQYFPIT
jgi:hypothetical protein